MTAALFVMVPQQIVVGVVLLPNVLLANPTTICQILIGPSRFGTFACAVLVPCSQLISLPARNVACCSRELRCEPTDDIDVCLYENLDC
jgi:hypothetical protein